jgi:hypothetical protein
LDSDLHRGAFVRGVFGLIELKDALADGVGRLDVMLHGRGNEERRERDECAAQ